MSGVQEWQINWVMLSLLRIIPAIGKNEPQASWEVIASHLIHGIVASIVFALFLPYFLSASSFARISVIVDALVYSFILWVIFSIAFKRVYERAGGIHILSRGILVSLLSHCVYGFFLGLFAEIYLLSA
jgi:Family of unknown function (DUF6789)